MVLCNSGDDPKRERQYLKVLYEDRIDGIIMSPTGENSDYVKSLVKLGLPIVCIDRIIQDVECDIVTTNNKQITFEAISYLIKNAVNRLIFISICHFV